MGLSQMSGQLNGGGSTMTLDISYRGIPHGSYASRQILRLLPQNCDAIPLSSRMARMTPYRTVLQRASERSTQNSVCQALGR